jgi:hypothetical protein
MSWEVRPKWIHSTLSPKPQGVHFFFKKVLNSLYVVIGGALKRLYLRCIRFGEIFINGPELCLFTLAGRLDDLFLSEEKEVFHFYPNPIFNESVF